MFEQILGIVLDNKRIDACLITRGLNSHEISLCISEPINEDIDSKDTKETGEYIKRLFNKKDINPDIIYTALPCSSVIFRYINLPFTDINKISKVYYYEIEQTLPCPLSELVFDFQIINKSREKGTDILIAAVPKRILEGHLDILKNAGLEPNAVTLNSIGLFFLNRSLSANKDNLVNGLLDINNNSATILISDHKRLLLTRQIDFLDPEHLIRELQMTLASFHSSHNLKIGNITLTGNKQQVMEMEELIKNRLLIKLSSLDGYDKLPFKYKRNGKTPSTLLAAPVGLCLIKRFKRGEVLNFRKGPYTYQKSFSIPRQVFYSSITFILLIMILGIINLQVRYDYYNNRTNILDKEINGILKKSFPNIHIGPAAIEDLKTAISKEVNIQKKYSGYMMDMGIDILDILREISMKVPKEYDMQTQEISYQDAKVRIKGKIDSFETLEKLISSLKESRLFKEIKTEESNIRGKGKQVSFTLLLEIQK